MTKDEIHENWWNGNRDKKSCCEGIGIGHEYQKRIEDLEKENVILKKALYLYVNWADECGVAWDNFPDMEEKWYKIVEEKGLGWIEGLIFMAIEEAKEQLMKEQSNSQEVSE